MPASAWCPKTAGRRPVPSTWTSSTTSRRPCTKVSSGANFSTPRPALAKNFVDLTAHPKPPASTRPSVICRAAIQQRCCSPNGLPWSRGSCSSTSRRAASMSARAPRSTPAARAGRQGVALLVVSSDLPEVLALADRIVVMAEGRTVGELPGEGATEEQVLRLATRYTASVAELRKQPTMAEA